MVTFSFGEITVGGHSARLTRSEYDILKALVEAWPEPRTLRELYLVNHRDAVLGENDKINLRTHLRNIRRTLKANDVPLVIENRKGFGYRARVT